MPEKIEHTTGFKSGQKTNDKEPGGKVINKNNMSKVRNAGQPDPLSQALQGKEPPLLPANTHPFTHGKTSAPGGAHYSPAGEFGRPRGNLGSKATGMGSHTSRPGSNSLGNPRNVRGGNPLGGHGGEGTFRGKP